MPGTLATPSTSHAPITAGVYDTSGQLVDAQYLDKTQNFDKKNCRLPRIRTEQWEGFIFINFDPDAGPLMDDLERWDFPRIYAPYQMGRLKLANKFNMNISCNWKFLNENLTDIYHIAVLHSGTFGPYQPLEGLPLQDLRRRLPRTLRRRDPSHPRASLSSVRFPGCPKSSHSGGFSSHIPPNVSWFPRFDYVSVNTNWPLTASTSLSITYQLFPRGALRAAGLRQEGSGLRRLLPGVHERRHRQ